MADDNILDIRLFVQMIRHFHELVVTPKSMIVRMIDVVESPVVLSTQDAQRVQLVSQIAVVVEQHPIRIRVVLRHVCDDLPVPSVSRRYHVI